MRSAPGILLLAAALAASACSGDGSSGPPDADRDGTLDMWDCDDTDPAVYRQVTAYADTDGDGEGFGQPSMFCTDGTAPSGHALDATDCAPTDATAWRSIALVDGDGDGFTTAAVTPVCAGETPPEPYRAVAAGNDCADADDALYRWVVSYRDEDGDGVGARPRSILCLGESLPAGWSVTGYDADDGDPSITGGAPEDDLALLVD
jgi:hypothetical protein